MFNSGDCAPTAGGTVPLMFWTPSALESARHGLIPPSRADGFYAHAVRACLANRRRASTFGHLGKLFADYAKDSLAVRQLGFTTGDARRILGCHLAVAYDTERGQHPEDRGAAPAANHR